MKDDMKREQLYQGLPHATLPPRFCGPMCIGPYFEECVLREILKRSQGENPVNPYQHVRVLWDCGTLNGCDVLTLLAVRKDYTIRVFLIDWEEFHSLVSRHGCERDAAATALAIMADPDSLKEHDFGGQMDADDDGDLTQFLTERNGHADG